MAADNDRPFPDNLSPGTSLPGASPPEPEPSSDDSAITAVNTPPPTTNPPNSFTNLSVPTPKRPPRRPLPSEQNTNLATKPADEARRQSNATRSTRLILLRFSGNAPRNLSPEERRQRDKWEARRVRALAALERLREPTKRSRIEHFWRVKTRSETLRLHHEPADYDAREACGFWFPRVADVPVHVCDFRAEGGSRQTARLADIEDCKE